MQSELSLEYAQVLSNLITVNLLTLIVVMNLCMEKGFPIQRKIPLMNSTAYTEF